MSYQPFRKLDAGNGVELPVNTHSATDNFFVDRSRLRTTDRLDYVPSENPMKMGKYVKRVETASIMDNVRMSVGDIRACGSFENRTESERREDTGDCCAPTSWGRNPITRRRGDD
jgi:hypothetical protein